MYNTTMVFVKIWKKLLQYVYLLKKLFVLLFIGFSNCTDGEQNFETGLQFKLIGHVTYPLALTIQRAACVHTLMMMIAPIALVHVRRRKRAEVKGVEVIKNRRQ